MKLSRFSLVCLIIPVVFICSPISLWAGLNELGTLTVIGVQNELEDDRWQDLRIGFGLTERIAQKMFDTDFFQLIEEDQEKIEKKKAVIRSLWSGSSKALSAKSVTKATAFFGVDFVAYGRVLSFKTSKSKAFVGPVSTQSRKSVLKLELCLFSKERGETLCTKGKGAAKVRANSLLFEFHGDNIQLDQSTVGKATDEALDDALKDLIKKIRKKW